MPRLREEQRIHLTPELRKRILRESGYRCAHCNKLLKHTKDDEFSIEHVVPLRKGGTNNPNNLLALCIPCNKEKQDDILEPRAYYKFAPDWKLDEVCQTFNDYIENTDWLAYDTLFKLDRFELRAKKSFLKPRTNQIYHTPAIYQVRKMRREAVLDWLIEYTGHLHTLDKEQMTTTLDEINTNYYAIVNKAGITVMIISPYILNTDYGTAEGPARTTIFLDYFVNPNLKLHPPGDYATFAHILEACTLEIRSTVENKNFRDKSCIDCIIRTPNSDMPAVEALHMFGRYYHPKSELFINGDDNGPRNLNLGLRFYNGTLEDLMQEVRAANTTRTKYEIDITTRQTEIKNRLKTSREVKSDKIKRVTKKEKKRKKRK